MEKFNGRPTSEIALHEEDKAVYDLLDGLGIEYETLCHKAIFTMQESIEMKKGLGIPVCKNLFLCNRQQTDFYLLMLPADKPFKAKVLSRQLGCSRLSFASEEKMVELLHIYPGAVSPMGLMNDAERKVVLVIDKDLLKYESFGCHPCVNTATIKLKFSDLTEKFLPKVEHEFRLVELTDEESGTTN